MRSVVLLSALTSTAALDNGLSLTPPMGYNSWYDTTCADVMDANYFRLTADLLLIHGLDRLGYRYVNLDGCFLAPGPGGRVNGTLQPDPRHFGGTEGIKALAKYLHDRGLLLGIYTDRGSKTCQGRAGSRYFEAHDAMTYADWGADYVKEDSCNAYGDPKHAFEEYGLMRDGLNATGRRILFAACGWHEWYAPPNPALNYSGGASLANVARIGPDNESWKDILINAGIMSRLAPYARPGYWNDPCLLLSVDWRGTLRVSELQSRAQFALWCVLSAPLLISGSLELMSEYTLATYTNAQAIAINQRTPKQGIRLAGDDIAPCASHKAPGPNCTNVWGKQLTETSWALFLMNAGSAPFDVACDAACLGAMNVTEKLLPLQVTEVWGGAEPRVVTQLNVVARALPAEGGHVLLVLNQTSWTW